MSKETEMPVNTCHLDLHRRPLAEGINSRVWRVGENVLKVYRISSSEMELYTNEKKLYLYRDVMNEASKLTEAEDWRIKLPLPFGEVPFRVNPYITFQKCEKCGYLEALAPFIPGLRLNSFPYSLFDYNFFPYVYSLEQKLGVEGIFFAPVNAKYHSGTLIVTDLSDDISALHKR